MQLDNWKISTRLAAGFGLVWLMTGALVAVGLGGLAGVGAASRDITGNDWSWAGAAAAVSAATQASARRTTELFLAADAAQAAALRQQLAAGEKAVTEALAALEQGSPPAEEKALLADIRSTRATHALALGKVARQLEAGEREAASRAWTGEARQTLDRLQQELLALAELQTR